MKISRRAFLLGGVAGAFSLGAVRASSSTITADQLQIEEHAISIPDLPAEFEGYRIGFLSDLHLGPFVSLELIESAVQQLRDAQVQLVLLGGDYLWVPDQKLRLLDAATNRRYDSLSYYTMPDRIHADLASALKQLAPPDGMIGVFGNHDRWVAPKSCLRAFTENGIRLVTNGTFPVSRGGSTLRVVALDDYWTGTPALPELPPFDPSREVRVALAHNPDLYEDLFAEEGHGVSLALAGHTHGGQVVLPVIGALTYNIRNLQYRSGFYQHPQGPLCYTSRGLGVVELPIRINCPPEVTAFSLHRA